ncbi:hypothetical protein TNIN_410641 [Trichonephila inaurata madagascariensis]|uniref:Uncharacterized protein n=1 Tax=Trichonephila inaurata madagascariensis TaxID=2747483 RepID=A0A8X6YKQ4_9ARAC|nr:hypothetical protein TNIN_410641 [Trichonephila inaurata madagascariensis]
MKLRYNQEINVRVTLANSQTNLNFRSPRPIKLFVTLSLRNHQLTPQVKRGLFVEQLRRPRDRFRGVGGQDERRSLNRVKCRIKIRISASGSCNCNRTVWPRAPSHYCEVWKQQTESEFGIGVISHLWK